MTATATIVNGYQVMIEQATRTFRLRDAASQTLMRTRYYTADAAVAQAAAFARFAR